LQLTTPIRDTESTRYALWYAAGHAFPGNGKQRWSEGRIAELERKVGQEALEIDFLKGCLQRRPRAKVEGRPYPLTRTPMRLRLWLEEQRMLQAVTGNPRFTGRSKKE
jgi:transposase